MNKNCYLYGYISNDFVLSSYLQFCSIHTSEFCDDSADRLQSITYCLYHYLLFIRSSKRLCLPFKYESLPVICAEGFAMMSNSICGTWLDPATKLYNVTIFWDTQCKMEFTGLHNSPARA